MPILMESSVSSNYAQIIGFCSDEGPRSKRMYSSDKQAQSMEQTTEIETQNRSQEPKQALSCALCQGFPLVLESNKTGFRYVCRA